MKNLKTQKGITLVALIITIVVLLILATVAITSMSEYDIIGKANAAAEKYENKAGIEDNTLKEYSSIIDKYMGNSNSGIDSDNGEQVILETPIISLVESVLSIQGVTNATSYDIYANGILKSNIATAELDLVTLDLQPGEYQITVIAKAEGYTNSQVSSAKSYTQKNTITFTINEKIYKAEENMTWGKWCDSGYNIDEFYVDEDDEYARILRKGTRIAIYRNAIPTEYPGKDSLILNDAEYFCDDEAGESN